MTHPLAASAAIASAHAGALRSIARVVSETTPPTPPRQALEKVTAQLRAGGVLLLTGAGVSTDSGIPDYRGEKGSLTRHRPMTYQEFRYDPVALRRYWARSFVGWRHIDRAQPNFIHRTLSAWEDAGHITGVITQNVDGLHQAAGSQTVVALHGDLATVVCLSCGAAQPRQDFDARLEETNPGFLAQVTVRMEDINPDGDVFLRDEEVERFQLAGCHACGSVLMKPDVVYFGENVPKERKIQVAHLLDRCRSVLVLGSSLAVMSGMKIVIDAKKQGKQVAAINGGPGRADDRVDVLWRSDLATAVRAVAAAL